VCVTFPFSVDLTSESHISYISHKHLLNGSFPGALAVGVVISPFCTITITLILALALILSTFSIERIFTMKRHGRFLPLSLNTKLQDYVHAKGVRACSFYVEMSTLCHTFGRSVMLCSLELQLDRFSHCSQTQTQKILRRLQMSLHQHGR
jgi:hypothetical protein